MSRYYGIALNELDPTTLFVLDGVLPHLLAEDELRQRHAEGKLTPERLKNLLILVTGDEDLADKAAAKLLLAELTQNG